MTPYPLGLLDVASGVLLGEDSVAGELPRVPREMGPRQALEAAVGRALQRPPCLVAFSGGRDSAAVLAVAVRVARQEGVPEPIPATLRFPQVAEAEESAWQERVVRHLGLADWVRIYLEDELDVVGPVAQRVLRIHGLLFPPNIHMVVPLADAARGGSLLSGLDGDGLFEGWRWQRGIALLRGRVPPTPSNLARLGLALAPRPLKTAVLQRRTPLSLPWLRPAAAQGVREAAAADEAEEPVTWPARVRWWARRRHLRALLTSADLLCWDLGVQGVHPLADPFVMAALARGGGWWGFGDRTTAMRELVGDLLPPEVVTRPTKATFSGVYWNRHARAFVATWSGGGVDPDLVDPELLREVWASPPPDFRSALLVQAAWRSAHSLS